MDLRSFDNELKQLYEYRFLFKNFFIFYNINCIKDLENGLAKILGEGLKINCSFNQFHCVIGLNISNHCNVVCLLYERKMTLLLDRGMLTQYSSLNKLVRD